MYTKRSFMLIDRSEILKVMTVGGFNKYTHIYTSK